MEKEPSFLSTSTVVSHPEHILLPEFGQETADFDQVETLISQQEDLIETLISQQEDDHIETLISQQEDDHIETLISQQEDDQIKTLISQEQESPRMLSRLGSELSFLMTEAEVMEDDKRLEERKQSLIKQQKYHDTWESDMKNRKLALSERVKKLKRFHKSRLVLYDDFKSYAYDMKRKLRNETDQDKELLLK